MLFRDFLLLITVTIAPSGRQGVMVPNPGLKVIPAEGRLSVLAPYVQWCNVNNNVISEIAKKHALPTFRWPCKIFLGSLDAGTPQKSV